MYRQEQPRDVLMATTAAVVVNVRNRATSLAVRGARSYYLDEQPRQAHSGELLTVRTAKQPLDGPSRRILGSASVLRRTFRRDSGMEESLSHLFRSVVR
jgi:hypothetical protein